MEINDKIISMLLQKLIDRADEVDGEEAFGSMKDEPEEDPRETEGYDSEDEDEDDELKLLKMFK